MNARILVAAGAAAVLVAGGIGLYLLMQPTRVVPASGDAAIAELPAAPAPETPAAPEALTPEAPPARAPRRAAAAPAEAPAESPAEPAAEAAPEVGTLRIESDVPGAQVFLDRQFVGTAPVTAENVRPGTHQLNVSAEGFEGIARSIDVAPGPADITVRFREVRLDASLPVVHRHRLGSCTGRLLATAQGLRYDTQDANDRFTVPFADLETFAVNYQEKNLRVKVRRGREYNFTDPGGSADALFVFHRDVDRARQRLAKGDVPASN